MRGAGARAGGTLAGAAVGLLVAAGYGLAALPGPAAGAAIPPLPLDPLQVARGRQVYLRHCASCHGLNAEGAPNWWQADARGNLPPPPHDDSGHPWRHSDVQLAEIIRRGTRDPFNRTPELTMPPFEGKLTDEEIAAVLAYFKSLWSPEHRRYQEEQNQRPPMPTPGEGR
ncbi:MAG TPA: cytochrome c [Thermodesulfobacteriota bacterium]|nr:cytochrome c [Thermodesulfobacteriota bacterium]